MMLRSLLEYLYHICAENATIGETESRNRGFSIKNISDCLTETAAGGYNIIKEKHRYGGLNNDT